jgi:hypothetical protein
MRTWWRIRAARSGATISQGAVALPQLQDFDIGMGSRRTAGHPLEDLHNRAIPGLANGDGVVGNQTFGTQQGNMLVSKLKQISFLAALGL